MKTNTRKTTRILCASTIAAMTLLGSVAPALTTVAAEGEIKLPVSENTISFDKKIYLEEDEHVPNATISYTLTPRTATEKETNELANSGYHNVVKGEVGLTASDTVFSAADDDKQGQTSVTKTSTIDASALTNVDKPTVFTYTLTENVQKDAAKFISTTKGETRDLNIYVGYAPGSNELSVLYSTLSRKVPEGSTVKTVKATGFENDYDTDKNDANTNAIKVTKKVTGNQGDKTEKFNFKVTITGQHSKVTATTTGDEEDLKATTPTPTNSTVTVETTLKDSQSLTLNGITKGATYTVEETDKDTNGYKTSSETKSENGIAETTFTNKREGNIPTGIYLNHKLPFNILGVALAGGAVALIAKKRHEEAFEDEDDE